jgi:hypothetical protein
MKLGYLYGGKIKGSIDLGTDPYTGLPSTFKSGGLDIDGDADLYFVAGQRLNVEKEGGVNEQYWAGRFKATSTDALALVDKWMAGVVAEAAATEGAIGGGASRISCIHGYMELGITLTGGAKSALATLQVAPGTNKTIDDGLAILPGGKTITNMIRLESGVIDYVLSVGEEIAGVVDKTTTGTGTITGYLKIRIGTPIGEDRYIYLYTAAPA